MAYSATYTADDAAPIIFDLGAAVLVGAGAMAAILGLVLGVAIIRKVAKR